MKHYLQKKVDYRFVYLMFNPKSGKTKIGIAKNTERRRSDIDRDVDGSVRIISVWKFIGAEKIEKIIQKRFARFHAPMKSGSGRTEWFKIPFLFRGLLYLFICLVWIEQRFLISFFLIASIWLSFEIASVFFG